MTRLLALGIVSLLAGCGALGGAKSDRGPTLADLEPVQLDQSETALPSVGLAELAGIYRDVLTHQQDAQIRLKILHRLADIEMLTSEAEFAEAIDQDRLFDPAISAYETLLQENPDYERRDTILYQLSKAYDLRGDPVGSMRMLRLLRESSPDSPYLAEANFRLAERHFARAEYARAEKMYARVVDFDTATPFYTRALYMLGWSRFKQDQYYASIGPFIGSLDQVLSVSGDMASNEITGPETRPRAQREMVADSLRVLALAFSNLEGTATIARATQELGERSYQHRLYEALGALYLTQERYRDSAGVYKAYASRYPESELAHHFQLRVVEAYERGGFPDLILAAKQDYVATFAVGSRYWVRSNEASRDGQRPVLRRYLEELASHFHASAQAASRRKPGAGELPDDAVADFALAASYYREFIDSFPEDPAVPGTAFLLAESLYEAREYQQAIPAYEDMAYTWPEDARAPDAAYMGILAHLELARLNAGASMAREAGPTNPPPTDEAIAAQIRFARQFLEDDRAAPVLGDAARQLLARGDHDSAVAVATELVERTPAPDRELQVGALLVIGHGQFELEEFAAAEQAYALALESLPEDDKRHLNTRERMAAAIYRSAEEQQVQEDYLAAAELFDQALKAAPSSAIADNALYDAAAAYQSAGELEQATRLFTRFRQQYPGHNLTPAIGPLLVSNFEALEQWESAAAELDALAGSLADARERRQAAITAAQYYDKVGATGKAIDRYRSYAHEWPSPLAPRMEAMYRLSTLYDAQGETQKTRFWLQKMESAHREAGREQGERSAFLAAQSCSRLAEDGFREFQGIALTLPVKRSLGRKQRAMQKTLETYSRCSEYGVEQFTTLASFRIGATYQALSDSLMESQRPASLDALALEQYDMMLEEQAFPFEEKAIAVHESNVQRCTRHGIYDEWVRASFTALESLVPARYRKPELTSLESGLVGEATRNRGKQKKLVKLNEAAIAARAEGDFTAAQDYYQKALGLAGDDALTHRNLGILLELYLGRPGEALEHYKRYQALTVGNDRVVAGWIAQLQRRSVSLAGGGLR